MKNLQYILIVLFICTPVFADTIPHQSKEIIEIYTRLDHIIYVDLELKHTYKVFDEIFILPDEFWGEAEFYDLKFYLDMDTTIDDAYSANCYRILYENRMPSASTKDIEVIPEPAMMLFFGIPLLIRKKSKLISRV